jgi:hypothetical protein
VIRRDVAVAQRDPVQLTGQRPNQTGGLAPELQRGEAALEPRLPSRQASTPSPPVERTAGALRYARATHTGLLPSPTRTRQINVGLSKWVDEKRGSGQHVGRAFVIRLMTPVPSLPLNCRSCSMGCLRRRRSA